MRNVRTILAALATLALSAGTAAAGDPKAAPAAPAKDAKSAPVAQATPAPAAKPAPAPAAKPAAAPAAKTAPAVKPTAATPAPAAKPAAGAAAVKADAKVAPGEPNPSAEPPKPGPAPELLAAAKVQAGTWRCTGNVFGPDGQPRPTKAIVKTKLDLDKYWLTSSFAETTGKNKFKFTSYKTFDAASKQYSLVMVDNWGGWASSKSSDGITWDGTSHSPMGTMKSKDTETVVSPKEMKMVGQYSSDNGKTWVNGYDITCKK